jgi:DNA polymerase
MTQNQPSKELLELLNETREYTRFLKELGVENVGDTANDSAVPVVVVSAEPARASAEPARSAAPVVSDQVKFSSTRSAPASSADVTQEALFASAAPVEIEPAHASESLEDIWRDIGECTRCGLCEGRTQVVNTHGNRKARLMFVGEAPGADEDAQGKPFVGRAGQLLTKIIEAIGLKREDVIIGNVNRCRPPGNRQPTLEEAAICRPFLFREIAAVQPEVIVVMGNTALRNLLEVREGITRVRGKFQDFRGIKVMPTFHPAYLLRDPSKKRETWEDLKKVRDFLDSTPARARN